MNTTNHHETMTEKKSNDIQPRITTKNNLGVEQIMWVEIFCCGLCLN